MSLKEIIKIQNGDQLMDYLMYSCNGCGEIIEEAWPKIETEDYKHYCINCSLIFGVIDEAGWIKAFGMSGYEDNCYVIIEDRETIFCIGRRPTGEKDRRTGPKYKEWRTSVFERDNYTCNKCGTKGGEINAHHVLSYKLYPEERLNIDNGMTLCKPCHKEEHRGSR